jgi:hypothetical protein
MSLPKDGGLGPKKPGKPADPKRIMVAAEVKRPPTGKPVRK